MKELANAHGPSCIAPVDFIYGLSHHHHHLIESDASTPDTIDDKKKFELQTTCGWLFPLPLHSRKYNPNPTCGWAPTWIQVSVNTPYQGGKKKWYSR